MAPPTQPNFLFFLPDQHRFDWVPWNTGLSIKMPTLADIASRGVRFSRAITPSPLCSPARACLASGLPYERCNVPDNAHNIPLEQPTYYRALRDAGYRVAGVGKFDLGKGLHDWGITGQRLLPEWGFTEGIDNEGKMDAISSYQNFEPKNSPKGPYMTYLKERGLDAVHVNDFRTRRNRGTFPTPLPDDAYCDNWIARNGAQFLRGFPTDQPWHLVVNFNGPHSPFDVTESMRKAWQDVPFPPPVENTDDMSPDEHQAIRQNYAAMLENIDRRMADLIQIVRDRGELDRTVIVYSSDHGEMLGDHDRWGKTVHYQPSVGIPFVVSGFGVSPQVAGSQSEALVSLHDVAATFVELGGAKPWPGMESRSVTPILRGETSTHRDVARSALQDWRMVWDGRHKLVRHGDDTLFYDLQEDPTEAHDLTDQRPEEIARLEPLLHAS
jgi:arylsulfatase A-like enzyme